MLAEFRTDMMQITQHALRHVSLCIPNYGRSTLKIGNTLQIKKMERLLTENSHHFALYDPKPVPVQF